MKKGSGRMPQALIDRKSRNYSTPSRQAFLMRGTCSRVLSHWTALERAHVNDMFAGQSNFLLIAWCGNVAASDSHEWQVVFE